MKGTVITLCPPENIQIPEEFLVISVDEERAEEELQRLSLRYAKEKEEETAQKGDTVFCRADDQSYPDGRTILLYTGVEMPGAEEASKAVLGKKAGEEVLAKLGGKDVTLTVEKVIRLFPVEVNDALIASMGLENIQTVAEYRSFTAEKIRQDAKMEKHKMAMAYIEQQMESNSTFAYEEEALNRELEENREAIQADYRAYGMPVPDDEEIRTGILRQAKQLWMAKVLCEQQGIQPDVSEAEEAADQMAEMMSLMGEEVPPREKLVEEAVNNGYVNELFRIVDEYVSERMGG